MNTPYEETDLYKMRHTLSHVLAAAVTELYPTAKFGIGPAIENGFYYDGEEVQAAKISRTMKTGMFAATLVFFVSAALSRFLI